MVRLGSLLVLTACVGTLSSTEEVRDAGRDAGRRDAARDAARTVDADAVLVDVRLFEDVPSGDDAADGAAEDGGTEGGPIDCARTTLPLDGLVVFYDAHEGVERDGDVVRAWSGVGASARRVAGGPRWVEDALGGHPGVVFDGDDDRLEADVAVDGARALTLTLLSASGRRAPGVEWCCRADETGCSGTYHTPIMWQGARDWGGVYVGAVQDEVSVRFGNNVKTYTGGDFYDTQVYGPGGGGTCVDDPRRDPFVAWTRPASIGEQPTLTTAVLEGDTIRLFVEGEEVWSRPMPAGGGVDTRAPLQLGAGMYGRHWRGTLSAFATYDRALDATERRALESTLRCRFDHRLESP
jgi:hypothetical protein